MRRFGWVGVLLVVALLAAGCASGKKIGGGISTDTTVPANASTTSDVCKTTQLQSTEVGVSPTTITVTVVADTGSPLAPGLFQDSVDAMQAWGNDINARGGLACRKIVVKTADSKLSPDETRNALTTA